MSADEDVQALQMAFDARWSALIADKSEVFDMDRDDLTLDTIAALAALLRTGQPSQTVLNMLTRFLEGVETRASESKAAHRDSLKLARLVLGYTPWGAEHKGVALQRSIATLEGLMDNGIDRETAEREAYDVYHYKKQSYATDSMKGLITVTLGSTTRQITVAERGLEDLRAKWRAAGVLRKKAPGAKPKKK